MNNELKFQYIESHWELRDGIIYSKRTGKPIGFSSKSTNGRGGSVVSYNGKHLIIQEHQAMWMLSNKQAIPDNFVIHHRDLDYTNNAPENLILLSKRAHQFYHCYIKGAKGYSYDPAMSKVKPWFARVSLPIGRVIVRRCGTEEEARAFVLKHQSPTMKALKAKGCLLLEDIAIN
ncbi:HNH endonuclease signature motif containing protein [Escherichia sp. MOD1-EC6099]|uniref:HNH endonuclease signature motif containing protein n=1 Tax=Escherichia sp. MOD1-EC6099 TaxID=2093885 RepID=UPI0012FFDD36|nr:HNH endonuclease signature motif containing protein [Escherichia sp. MOD1-EC6099]